MGIKNLLRTALLSCLCFFSFKMSGQETQSYAGNHIVIKFKTTCKPRYTIKNGVALFSSPVVDELNKKYHCVSARRINAGRKSTTVTYTYVLEFSTDIDVLQAVRDYNGTGCLQYAEPDYKGSAQGSTSTTPNDLNFSTQWSLYNNGTFGQDSAIAGADIKMKEAWDIETGDSNVIVAVTDCGIKLDHPEFAGRIWVNYAEIPGNGIDDDGNGYIDDVKGWDMAYNDNDPSDDYGHGTNVASIIGENGNNNVGFAGMDWHCKIMALKVLNSNDVGYYTWWAEAITYATDNGAKVINMSLGGNNASTVLQDAIDYAHSHNVTVVVAMGNGNSNAPSYPGACNNVIAVGATNAHDCRVNPFFWGGGSNFGTNISVVAPGNYIYGLNYTNNNNYTTYWGGTSQATPHVSGLVALLLAQDNSRTPDQLKQIIEATADDMVGNPTEDTPGWDQYYGHGRINAYRALTYHPANASSITSNKKIELHPNPSTGMVSVYAPGNNSLIHYTVTSITGTTILNGMFATNSSQIDLSAQAKGIYIIRLSGKDLNYVQQELIK